jgi:hypothetical protein
VALLIVRHELEMSYNRLVEQLASGCVWSMPVSSRGYGSSRIQACPRYDVRVSVWNLLCPGDYNI